MPLRQPPAEQPFSLIPPNWNPVSNDRVLLRLGLINSDSPLIQPNSVFRYQPIMAREVLSIGTASTQTNVPPPPSLL